MKIIFTALAAKELQDARAYYELELSGLGSRFTIEVRAAITRIIEHPTAWSTERGDVRRCNLHHFPYKILYAVEPDYIVTCRHRPPASSSRLLGPVES